MWVASTRGMPSGVQLCETSVAAAAKATAGEAVRAGADEVVLEQPKAPNERQAAKRAVSAVRFMATRTATAGPA